MAEVKRDEFDEERERREYRRRRRIRNQVIAYVFAVLILAFGIHSQPLMKLLLEIGGEAG